MPPPTMHVTRDALRVECPAKVNLALAVGAPDKTDETSFHPIATWMVALRFADELTLRRLNGGADGDPVQSRYEIHFADDAPVPGAIDWPLEKDLAHRAHRALERAVGRALPIELILRKRIPTGAGLGGGSSDAAGVLWGLNTLFQLNLSAATLGARAAELGSDVPFLVAALDGAPAALATGRGDRLESVALASPVHLVLVLPSLSCATGGVYAAFDELAATDAHVDEARVRRVAQRGVACDDELFNDLADAACRVSPPLAETRARVAEAAGRRAHVTGSGAAMFVLARDAEDAASIARRVTDRTGLAAVPTQSRA